MKLGTAVQMPPSRPSTSSAAGSPASPSQPPASARARQTTAGSGPSSPVSFAKFNPDGSLSRMYQDSYQLMMDGSFEEYSGTFPKAGMSQSGVLYRLPTWGRRTSERGSSLWPTPDATNRIRSDKTMEVTARQRLERHGQRTVPLYLAEAVQRQPRWPTPQAYSHGPDSNPPWITKLDIEVRGMWPTPQAHDTAPGNPARVGRFGTKHGGRNLNDEIGGQLNPTWVEWLMGFPLAWTDLGAWATPSSRKSPSTSAGS